MAILVDYRCGGCGAVAERWAPSPPPASVACGSCGGQARRAWAAVGLARGAPQPAPGPPAAPGRRPLCSRYPQVPGLCHMSESAGRAWLARYAGDDRLLDRELARQEKRAGTTAPVLSDAVTHRHFAGPSDRS